MEQYGNLSGDSGVLGYELGAKFIRVHFDTGAAYLYTYASCGAAHCEHMKLLAAQGRGLNGFINSTVRKRYERRER